MNGLFFVSHDFNSAPIDDFRINYSLKSFFQPHLLTILAKNEYLFFYFDKVLAGYTIDDEQIADTIKLNSCNYGNSSARVHFDNLRIWDISDMDFEFTVP
jgi:hypothetical protein